MSFKLDYIDLFLKKRSGHMAQYVHMYRPEIYEEIIKQDFYYPFKMECDLITTCMGQLREKLQNISEVLELGPGSLTPIVSKTVPFLKALRVQSPISVYKAIDATREYAEQASHIIQEHFPDMTTEASTLNFLAPNAFKKIQKDCNTM
ncbi:MAG: L-histidine N(alpha)-methyltransferase, partial [Candidatus Nucleicultricaceae bacterium]